MPKPQGAFAPPRRIVDARPAPQEKAAPVVEDTRLAQDDAAERGLQQSGQQPLLVGNGEGDGAGRHANSVVESGELIGFSVEEYTQAVLNGISDAMGEVDLRTAGCALDMALAEFLNVTMHAEGQRVAAEFGRQFAETVLPFASLQLNGTMKYGELLKLKGPK